MRRRRNCWRWYVHVHWRYVCLTWRSPRQSFREWLKPFWYFCLYTLFVVAHSWCSLPFLQSLGLMFGCLHASDIQGNVVVGFSLDCLPILDELWWHNHTSNRFPHTPLAQREYRGWLQLNLNKHVSITNIYCCLNSRVGSSMCSPSNWWILQSNYCYLSYEMKLPTPQWLLSLSTLQKKMKKHCSRDLVWRTCFDSPNMNVQLLYFFFGSIQAVFLAFSMLKVHSAALSWKVGAFGFRGWISRIPRSVLDDFKCRSQFFCFQNVHVREMVKSHSVLGLVIRLDFP